MHITQHTDYALRVLMFLAANEHRRPTIKEISDTFGISRNHLMKVVNALIREGFVQGMRGRGGGLRLAQPPAQIRIGTVVRVMEPGLNLVECFGTGGECLLQPGCRLTGVLSRALEAFMAQLDAATLADIVGPRQHQVMFVATT
ncbi:Rrf2 family transcriptional regulator [Nitrogeniibacter aestuarii]|uniref:Rrf2 family transcriptional regulator n=1 Tax=Nitrogeniibacter aestuarii TaxID=2815343 RepID=UPI001D12C2E5|nr:Rrf2 family transcriptional regulator [Nitrogeniibacter aestuarii]